MNILGVTMAFNEEDCVGNAVDCLLRVCSRVLAIDHGSGDRTGRVIKKRGDRVELVKFDRQEVPFEALWGRVARMIMKRRKGFGWLLWLSADERLRAPDGELVHKEALEKVARNRYRVIRPAVREFWLSDRDDEAKQDYLQRLQHYRMRNGMAPCPRFWKINLTPQLRPHLHVPDHGWGVGVDRVCTDGWILDHYPVRSMAQGIRKIMKERPRRAYLDKYRRVACRNLVRRAEKLACLE